MTSEKEPLLEAVRAYLSVEADDRNMPGWRRARAAYFAGELGELIAQINRKAH